MGGTGADTALRDAERAASANPVTRGDVPRRVLRTADAVPAVKRRMFADLGS
ncbi:hypothetical protein [Planosporangium mesophilum]|uniref:Uncharacterized protein n=1 Tax=Planosporangium mesophilum TaxID=689768 RepID=A0A8J3X6M9_9ACTN|nr:hypothetical protein [Planosporangium mesophilum]NJC86316.1 hypothetical protein [Planosporangium mesophilum]GII25893.1 hypothetical protein Pme01_54900 [Planosporangium mesophilum]